MMPSRFERNKNFYKQINQQINEFEKRLQNKESSKTKEMLEKVDPSFFDDLKIKGAAELLEKKVNSEKVEKISKKEKRRKKINIPRLCLIVGLSIGIIVIIILLLLM